MKKIYIILTILIQFTLLNAGRYAGDFMLIGSGVRALSMGGAYAAVADDGTAVYWNAAGVSQIRKYEASMMRAFLYDGLAHYDNITYCHPLPNEVTLGFNWIRLTIDDIPVYSESHLIGTNIDQRSAYADLQLTANPDEQFKSTDDLFQFTFSKHMHYDSDLGWFLYVLPIDYHLGTTFKYIKRKIMENSGDGNGFDLSFLMKTNLGLLVDQEWMGDISVGLNMQDVGGTVITWDTQSKHEDEVLFNTKVGFAFSQPIKKYHSSFIIAYDKDYVYNKTDHIGLEWTYKKDTKLRLGFYDNNFSAGAGVEMYGVKLDYAFITNTLGNTNRIGLGVRF